MGANRVFFSQRIVDAWLESGLVGLDGDVLQLLPDGPTFQLTSAVHITSEVAGGGDAPQLCGKVKTLDALSTLSAEVAAGSVVLGDNAYEVVDGFLGDVADAANAGGALAKLVDLAARAGEG